MNYLKMLGLVVAAAAALMALAGSAAATTLSIGGTSQNKAVALEASIASGGSVILKDTNNLTVDTCKESTVKGSTAGPFTGVSVGGAVSTLAFNGCSHKTVVIKPGSFSISWATGTWGTVSSSGAEVTVDSTIFGISCIAATGAGTAIGTYTGVKEGGGVMDVNGVIGMGICGDANWTGSYKMTTSGVGVHP